MRNMHPLTPAFVSALSYSVQNEDYATELAVVEQLDRNRPLRLLMVASSGENVLSVLTQERVAGVWAVDLNPAQVHVCALRAAACQALTRDEQLVFLGATAGTPVARVALFNRVRLGLPPPTRDFWDAAVEREIAFGLHHVGRNDCLMHDLQLRLAAAGFAPLRRALTKSDLPAWRAAYADVLTAPHIRDRFGLPSEALAARIASISGTLAETHFRALQQPDAWANPFVTTVFVNGYATQAGDAGLPLYLQASGQADLLRLGIDQRLHLETGNVLAVAPDLAGQVGGFDLISLSNIADWMDDAQFDAAVRAMKSCLTAGGALLARTATGSSMIVDVMRRHLYLDDALQSALPKIERGPWFRTLAAGRRA